MAKRNDISLNEVNKNSNLQRDDGTKFIGAVNIAIAHKAKLRAAQAAEKAAYYDNLSALADREWEKVRQKAHDILHGGRQGYESPLSALLDILVASEQRNKAIFAHNSLLHFFYRQLWEGSPSLPFMKEGLKDFVLGQDTPPGVKHFVAFNDDNTLCIKQLIRNNSSNPLAATRNMVRGNTETQFTQEQMLAFQGLVVAWLEDKHGCKPDTTCPGKFRHTADGSEVTKEYFDNAIMGSGCSDDKDLDSYLKEKLKDVPVENLRPR
jgi:hypothetical protein